MVFTKSNFSWHKGKCGVKCEKKDRIRQIFSMGRACQPWKSEFKIMAFTWSQTPTSVRINISSIFVITVLTIGIYVKTQKYRDLFTKFS